MTDTTLAVATRTVPARLAMRGITKSFGNATVLRGIDIEVASGEIHGLLGQNGAGKSTLVKILGGIYPDHGGEIDVDGSKVSLESPRQALAHGVGMIYQELSLIPSMTVAENIALGIEPGRVRLRRAEVRRLAAAAVSRSPLLAALPLDRPVGELGAGSQQMVEIAKALARDARVLVLDEPTARLSGPERDGLHALMRELAAVGTSMVYISHFLDDVLDITDSLTVLRNGGVVASGPSDEFDIDSLVKAMLSRELLQEETGSHPSSVRERRVLQLENVSVGERVHDVSLIAREGEIVVITGLVGSGRTRLASAIAGAEPLKSGRMLVDGEPVRFRSPRSASRAGIVFVAEDRKVNGVIGSSTASDNLVLQTLDKRVGRHGFVTERAIRRLAQKEFDRLDVQPRRPGLDAASFSGGNQQKILIGRALLADPVVLVVDQPTAGVDIGAKQQIHGLLRDAAKTGTTLIVVSDDLDEVLALADTVLVMKRGRIVRSVQRAALTRDALVDLISD